MGRHSDDAAQFPSHNIASATDPSVTNPVSSIPPGSVNEYQLRLGRQRQVWFIPFSGWTWGVQVKLWDPLRTPAISERLRGVFMTRRYTNPRLPLPVPPPKKTLNVLQTFDAKCFQCLDVFAIQSPSFTAVQENENAYSMVDSGLVDMVVMLQHTTRKRQTQLMLVIIWACISAERLQLTLRMYHIIISSPCSRNQRGPLRHSWVLSHGQEEWLISITSRACCQCCYKPEQPICQPGRHFQSWPGRRDRSTWARRAWWAGTSSLSLAIRP